MTAEHAMTPDPGPSPHRPLHILFVTARFPGPGPRGDQLRAYQHLRLLGPRHRITLVSFGDHAQPPASLDAVSKLCEQVVIVPPSRVAMGRSLVRGLFSRRPVQVALHDAPAMRQAVAAALDRGPWDVVHVQLVRMAPYLPAGGRAARVVDLVDALSVNMAQRFRHDQGPARWLARLESARLSRYEREVCRAVDRALVASPADREAIGPFPSLATIHNGVDVDEFAFERTGRAPAAMILSGNMGYFPNVHAVRWFARLVLPRVRRAVPGAELRVVGARPHRALRRLAARDPAVVVAGPVERMPPHLHQAAIAVAPLHAGSGQALKVLEAMACGTPVVATPLVAAGIGARDEEHLLVAEGAEPFAGQVVRLLRDAALAERLAASARRFVEARYTWEHSAAALEMVYRSVVRGSGLDPVPSSAAALADPRAAR